jgi:hypothetical protein
LSAWFLFSGNLNTNVDFSNFILDKIYSKLDVRKQIKICPETALKYFFEKMHFHMKYIVKKIEGDEYLCPWTVVCNIPYPVDEKLLIIKFHNNWYWIVLLPVSGIIM